MIISTISVGLIVVYNSLEIIGKNRNYLIKNYFNENIKPSFYKIIIFISSFLLNVLFLVVWLLAQYLVKEFIRFSNIENQFTSIFKLIFAMSTLLPIIAFIIKDIIIIFTRITETNKLNHINIDSDFYYHYNDNSPYKIQDSIKKELIDILKTLRDIATNVHMNENEEEDLNNEIQRINSQINRKEINYKIIKNALSIIQEILTSIILTKNNLNIAETITKLISKIKTLHNNM